uniref:Uncharacterized protein n=1 Tax=Cacopsylla melanoneura TaxID=428564 RepID=A0A8D9BFZ0_9HEMI
MTSMEGGLSVPDTFSMIGHSWGTLVAAERPPLPGTDTKNLTASLWPWNESCACAMEQYGMKLPGDTTAVVGSENTLTPLLAAPAPEPFPVALGPALDSLRGTEMITPFPVPIQRREEEMRSAVMRTKEKPSFPVPSILLTYGSMSTSCKC